MLQKPVPPLKSPVGRIVADIKATLSTLILFSALLAANFVQMASLVVRPFSIRLFRAINRACAGGWWGLGWIWTENLYGIRAVLTGDEVPAQENAIVVANHQQMPDIIALWSLAGRKGRLGDMKWIVKDALKWVPGIGWGMLFLDCLFLKRNWETDQEMIHRAFDKFSRENIPIWLVSFSEGTRITPAKLQRSQEYARKAGLPIPRNVMVPRTKGFVASVKGLRNHISAVYDVTIAYPGGVPTLWNMVQGRVSEFHLHVRRYPIDSLPADDEGVAEWLVARFREKDAWLERFLSAPSPA